MLKINAYSDEFVCADVEFLVRFGQLYTRGTKELRTQNQYYIIQFRIDMDEEITESDYPSLLLRRIADEDAVTKKKDIEIEITMDDLQKSWDFSSRKLVELQKEHDFLDNMPGYQHYRNSADLDIPKMVEKYVNRFTLSNQILERFVTNNLRNIWGDSPIVQRFTRDLINDYSHEFENLWAELHLEIASHYLDLVITASEADQWFQLQPGTTQKACQRESVISRKAGRVWLISLEDAADYWRSKTLPTEKTFALIEVSEGSLNNSYIKISGAESLFPEAVFGGSSHKDSAEQKLKLHVQGLDDIIQTDIDGTKNIFRGRGWCRRFFKFNDVQPGTLLRIEKLSKETYTFKISVADTQETSSQWPLEQS